MKADEPDYTEIKMTTRYFSNPGVKLNPNSIEKIDIVRSFDDSVQVKLTYSDNRPEMVLDFRNMAEAKDFCARVWKTRDLDNSQDIEIS